MFSGVKQRLYAGFALVALITLASCGVGLYLFNALQHEIGEISRDKVPAMRVVLRIAKESQRVNTLVSLLEQPDKTAQHQTYLAELRHQWIQLQQLASQFSRLRDREADGSTLLMRSELIDDLIAQFPELEEQVQECMESSAKRRAIANHLSDLGRRHEHQLGAHLERLNQALYALPGQRFRPERLQLLNRRHQNLNQYLRLGDTLQTEVEQISTSPAPQLSTARNTATALLTQLEQALLLLEEDAAIDGQTWHLGLKEAIHGEDSIFTARASELQKINAVHTSLERHEAIAAGLTVEAEKWVQGIHTEINRATNVLGRQIDSYMLLLVFATLIFLMLVFGLVWLYVGRGIIVPLIATSRAMNAIAAGDTDTQIPPFGEGEIGKMLKSLARLKAYVVQVKNQAQRDGLTALYNRRQFDETLERELRRAIREQAPFSLILADIDHFKAYNDTYGHIAGDGCLKAIAQLLHRQFNRASDLCARYGGEEFAIILPGTGGDAAALLTEGFVAQVEALKLPHKTSPTAATVTISAGVTTLVPTQDHTPQMLIDMADKALYQAKEEGRNRLVQNSLSD